MFNKMHNESIYPFTLFSKAEDWIIRLFLQDYREFRRFITDVRLYLIGEIFLQIKRPNDGAIAIRFTYEIGQHVKCQEIFQTVFSVYSFMLMLYTDVTKANFEIFIKRVKIPEI